MRQEKMKAKGKNKPSDKVQDNDDPCELFGTPLGDDRISVVSSLVGSAMSGIADDLPDFDFTPTSPAPHKNLKNLYEARDEQRGDVGGLPDKQHVFF